MRQIKRPSIKDINLVVTILNEYYEGLTCGALLAALSQANESKIPHRLGRLLTYSEAAELWSCSKRHIQYLCEQGKISTVKIGPRGIRIPEDELVKFTELVREKKER